jgi:hypothetical protein
MVFFIPWRVVAEESGAAHFGLGGALLLDLLDRPGRCSGSWPHDSMVRSPAAPSISILVIFRFEATMELGRSGRSMMMMTSASPGRAGGDGDGAGRARRGTGSSTIDRQIPQH